MASAYDEIGALRVIYGLKKVYRHNSVGDRKESTVEHTFSSLVLADFLLHRYDFGVNKEKVSELLIYHDLVEVHVGDTPLHPGVDISGKGERERAAALGLLTGLPAQLASRYKELYEEFESQKTREARLARAIEQFDAEIHELDYKNDLKGWTERFLRESKENYFKGFPELERLFEEHVRYLRENGYFEVK